MTKSDKKGPVINKIGISIVKYNGSVWKKNSDLLSIQ
jgi:hypothetical protein